VIADCLTQRLRYTSLSSRFGAAFEFLEQLPADVALGRHDIDGDHCFALVQAYTTKPLAEARFEAHRKYIDIQFIQSGHETLLWAPLSLLGEATEPYLEEKDVAFFGTPGHYTPVCLQTGEFAIFHPTDGHAPCLECGPAKEVRKVVIKVQV